MLGRFRVIDCRRRTNEHCVSVKRRSVKARTTVSHGQCGHQNPERKEQRCWSQETASLRECAGKDVEGTKGAVGQDQSREEEGLGQSISNPRPWLPRACR